MPARQIRQVYPSSHWMLLGMEMMGLTWITCRQALESIVLFNPFNNPVMWAHLLIPIFKDEENCSFERLHDFSQEVKLFWTLNLVSLYYIIFLSFRVIDLALKCLKKKRGWGQVSKLNKNRRNEPGWSSGGWEETTRWETQKLKKQFANQTEHHNQWGSLLTPIPRVHLSPEPEFFLGGN